MSRLLFTPSTDAAGVSVDALRDIMDRLNDWRESYLPRVGVPTNFAAEWDFVSAVSACASDATFHIMWIILFTALDEYGVKEINEAVRSGSVNGGSPSLQGVWNQVEEMKRKVLDEALHGALRIAGLVSSDVLVTFFLLPLFRGARS